jgi:AcrR family transcriptional regulator
MKTKQTRQEILARTRELLSQQDGAGGITVSQVAAAAHVSRATLYRYFPDKAALLRAAGVTDEQSPNATSPRLRILEAVLEVAGERGMHAATLDEIASRAGLSRSGLHWHYKNKDELLADLAHYIPFLPTVEAEASQAGAEDADLETQLTRIAAVILEELGKRRGLLRFLLLEAAIYPDIARLASTHTIGRGLPLLAELFERHARAGRLRPGSAQARAQAFMGMFMVLLLLRPMFAPLLAPDDQETAQEYIEILLHGILAAPQ